MSLSKNLEDLYEIDDSLWLEKTINLIKENRWQDLDKLHLIEELEGVGKRDKLAVASLLEQVIRHLLLLEYWDNEYERSHRHWMAEIRAFRRQLNKNLTTNLRNFLRDNLDSIYQDARQYVQIKSNLDVFPLECPYSLKQLLDESANN